MFLALKLLILFLFKEVKIVLCKKKYFRFLSIIIYEKHKDSKLQKWKPGENLFQIRRNYISSNVSTHRIKSKQTCENKRACSPFPTLLRITGSHPTTTNHPRQIFDNCVTMSIHIHLWMSVCVCVCVCRCVTSFLHNFPVHGDKLVKVAGHCNFINK